MNRTVLFREKVNSLDGRPRVVCTRTLDRHLVDRSIQAGVDIECLEFIKITFPIRNLPPSQLSKIHGTILVITSVNALVALKQLSDIAFPALRCYCIEGRTAQVCKSIGMDVISVASTGKALAEIMMRDGVAEVLHVTGNIRLPDPEHTLMQGGVDVSALEVYYKETVLHTVGEPDAVMFFSQSQVRAFLSANNLSALVPAFCIGPTTAHFLRNSGHANVVVAKKASAESLIDSVINHFGKS